VVGEQVDFIDVEDAAVGLREQAGAEPASAFEERGFKVQRADDTVLGRAEGKLDECGMRSAECGMFGAAGVVGAVGVVGVVGVFGMFGMFGVFRVRSGAGWREERGEAAGGGAFGRAAFAADEDAADARVDGVEQEREAEVVLADNGGEGEGRRGRRKRRHGRELRIKN
jgi:hypothetical protein